MNIFKHGLIKKLNKKLNVTRLLMMVFAEEPPTGQNEPPATGGATPPEGAPANTPPEGAPANTPPTINYEDLIAKARKEEKDKLYLKLTALENDKKDLIEKHNTALIKIGTLETEIDTLKAQLNAKGSDGSEELTKLRTQLANTQKELEEIKNNTVAEDEIVTRVRAEVQAEYEVKLYREQKLREVGDNVIPELVIGTTKEEIDNSITVAQTRFEEILARVGGRNHSKIPASNLNTTKIQGKELNINDIANLDPRSPEYAEFRKQMGLK